MRKKEKVFEKVKRGAIVGMLNDDRMIRLLVHLMGNSAQVVNQMDVDLKGNPVNAVRKFIVEEITEDPREILVIVEKLRMSIIGAIIACYQENRDEEYNT